MESPTNSPDKIFASGLRMERNKLNLTQAEFAVLAGVSKASQVTYESGTTKPDSLYFINLAKSGVNISRLLTGADPQIEHWDAIESIMGLIDEWSKSRQSPATPAQWTILIRLLYEQYRNTGLISEQTAKLLFTLVDSKPKA